jgi:hypothetical protein
MTTFFAVVFWVTHAIPPKPKLPTPYKVHCVFRWIFLTIQMWKVSLLCCTYPSLTKSEELPLRTCMEWNYFGSGHNKGRWDGVGASIKQARRSKQVKPNGV